MIGKSPGLALAILDKHGPGAADAGGEKDDLGGQQMDLKMALKALGVQVGDSPNWSKAVDCLNSFASKSPEEEAEEDHDDDSGAADDLDDE